MKIVEIIVQRLSELGRGILGVVCIPVEIIEIKFKRNDVPTARG